MARKTNVRVLIGYTIILAGMAVGVFTAKSTSLPTYAVIFGDREDELKPGNFYTVVDEGKQIIDYTARSVTPGDEIITAEGKRYRVEGLTGKIARSRLLGIDRDILAWDEYFNRTAVPAGVFGEGRDIGIYHTHSDESYVPTDGTPFIPYRGGIMKVGTRLADELRGAGTRTVHDRTPHDPHDASAYIRSRKTAVRLLRSNPIALMDVHRDGIPDPDFYRQQVSGMSIGQVRLVVGRHNPKSSANLDFAKRLMTYANRVHPGTVKGIFLAAGTFNQDLLSTALLLECGTHTLTRQEAERGVGLLADAVPVVLGLANPGPGFPDMTEPITGKNAKSPGAWRAFAWILFAVFIVAGTFLVVSAGGWTKAWERLTGFWRRETGVFPGRGTGRRDE
ncbi:MAG: stage II sporulation protein P [Bacillota bacterium]